MGENSLAPTSILPQRGWFYDREAFRNDVHYSWGDASETILSGRCDVAPLFVLGGGDYDPGHSSFELFVDDRQWQLQIRQGQHGGGLVLNDPAIVEAIANASRRVRFVVGSWSRELSPDPVLKRFVTECEAIRAADPDADGRAG